MSARRKRVAYLANGCEECYRFGTAFGVRGPACRDVRTPVERFAGPDDDEPWPTAALLEHLNQEDHDMPMRVWRPGSRHRRGL